YFFFTSRRRHTRSKRDWSSDVCSSDLSGTARRILPETKGFPQRHLPYQKSISVEHTQSQKADQDTSGQKDGNQRQMIQQQKIQRSEERRVGKECRKKWRQEQYNKEA